MTEISKYTLTMEMVILALVTDFLEKFSDLYFLLHLNKVNSNLQKVSGFCYDISYIPARDYIQATCHRRDSTEVHVVF